MLYKLRRPVLHVEHQDEQCIVNTDYTGGSLRRASKSADICVVFSLHSDSILEEHMSSFVLSAVDQAVQASNMLHHFWNRHRIKVIVYREIVISHWTWPLLTALTAPENGPKADKQGNHRKDQWGEQGNKAGTSFKSSKCKGRPKEHRGRGCSGHSGRWQRMHDIHRP